MLCFHENAHFSETRSNWKYRFIDDKIYTQCSSFRRLLLSKPSYTSYSSVSRFKYLIFAVETLLLWIWRPPISFFNVSYKYQHISVSIYFSQLYKSSMSNNWFLLATLAANVCRQNFQLRGLSEKVFFENNETYFHTEFCEVAGFPVLLLLLSTHIHRSHSERSIQASLTRQ